MLAPASTARGCGHGVARFPETDLQPVSPSGPPPHGRGGQPRRRQAGRATSPPRWSTGITAAWPMWRGSCSRRPCATSCRARPPG